MKTLNPGDKLDPQALELLRVFAKACRHSIVKMVTNAQSGHPGGSLSSLDFLAALYLLRLSQTNERIVVSNGHISPAIYAVLAELGVIPKDVVVNSFRKSTDIYEGHVNLKIPGVHYGTGPLGVGASVAAGMATADRLFDADRFTFLVMGDGEQQEGQVYEMMQFAAKYNLKNLIAFIDYNEVQLTDSLESIMPIHIEGHYRAAGWEVHTVDGHDYEALWQAISTALLNPQNPSVILCKTITGKGVDFMEKTGLLYQSDWHGKAPKPAEAEETLKALELTADEQALLTEYFAQFPSKIGHWDDEAPAIDAGTPTLYEPGVMTDCRGAYGKALLDLAEKNPQIVAMTADLADSVKTSLLKEKFPNRHIECGIAEQHMVSAAGGISLQGLVPFCSTFGVFMSSRAKDQARVNDINETNVKMVSTHCGLSVGEDGPTHQAIDDISSFLGFFHTSVFEPADPNHCDRMIRTVGSTPGNVYVRMGRAKIPVLLKEDGSAFYDASYKFEPGKLDVYRTGSKLTIVAAGPMVTFAETAAKAHAGEVEILIAGSMNPFDHKTLAESVKKTGRVLVVHDHIINTGLGRIVKDSLFTSGLLVPVKVLGVSEYQLSGTADELYKKSGMDAEAIGVAISSLLR